MSSTLVSPRVTLHTDDVDWEKASPPIQIGRIKTENGLDWLVQSINEWGFQIKEIQNSIVQAKANHTSNLEAIEKETEDYECRLVCAKFAAEGIVASIKRTGSVLLNFAHFLICKHSENSATCQLEGIAIAHPIEQDSEGKGGFSNLQISWVLSNPNKIGTLQEKNKKRIRSGSALVMHCARICFETKGNLLVSSIQGTEKFYTKLGFTILQNEKLKVLILENKKIQNLLNSSPTVPLRL